MTTTRFLSFNELSCSAGPKSIQGPAASVYTEKVLHHGIDKLSMYVQRRLVYSVGVNPTRTKVRVL